MSLYLEDSENRQVIPGLVEYFHGVTYVTITRPTLCCLGKHLCWVFNSLYRPLENMSKRPSDAAYARWKQVLLSVKEKVEFLRQLDKSALVIPSLTGTEAALSLSPILCMVILWPHGPLSPSSVLQGIVNSYSTLPWVMWEAVTVVEGIVWRGLLQHN